eukprot:gnl/TRDRNA2_/TRDRNA2_80276_c0_seq1.p1 gnl/TRDRNA2_/TRDRNA2_80276_c0~~gnl/TRDRNA2_/TRDRNA2_80276_c0_seq1.p1  ORF type:complete len:349 (+),score=61.19 gnl/TRDRNA2_/TRDRNA2_80276_c0_seq1:52-1098(+)
MRFGKKLALQVTDDVAGAPYLSHKLMKEAINKTVRELRVLQGHIQSPERGPWLGEDASQGPWAEEMAALEKHVEALDGQLFDLVDEDLTRILAYIRTVEQQLEEGLAKLQSLAACLGIMVEESQLQSLESVLPVTVASRSFLCESLLELRFLSDPAGMWTEFAELVKEYNVLIDAMNAHCQYLEINVAGFRKLLKRHEKQIPKKYHTRHTPYLGFHKLVTHTSRQILELITQFGKVMVDSQSRIASLAMRANAEGRLGALDFARFRSQPDFHVLKNLGAECQMALDISRQLKNLGKRQALPLCTTTEAAPGFLYPKPGSVASGASAGLPLEQLPHADGLLTGYGRPMQ